MYSGFVGAPSELNARAIDHTEVIFVPKEKLEKLRGKHEDLDEALMFEIE